MGGHGHGAAPALLVQAKMPLDQRSAEHLISNLLLLILPQMMPWIFSQQSVRLSASPKLPSAMIMLSWPCPMAGMTMHLSMATLPVRHQQLPHHIQHILKHTQKAVCCQVPLPTLKLPACMPCQRLCMPGRQMALHPHHLKVMGTSCILP